VITVAIADDHPVFRRGLRELLVAEGTYEVVAEVADGTDVAGAVEEHRPDVVVLDLGLPGADGLTVTKELIARYPSCRILIVTLHDDASLASRCLEAGAMGYVAKHADVPELLRAVAADLGRRNEHRLCRFDSGNEPSASRSSTSPTARTPDRAFTGARAAGPLEYTPW